MHSDPNMTGLEQQVTDDRNSTESRYVHLKLNVLHKLTRAADYGGARAVLNILWKCLYTGLALCQG